MNEMFLPSEEVTEVTSRKQNRALALMQCAPNWAALAPRPEPTRKKSKR